MGPIEAGIVVAAVMLPMHALVQRKLTALCDRRNILRHGVVIRRTEVLEARPPVLGRYRGSAVHASVVFLGLEYRFDRITTPAYRERVRPRELFVEPGLIYITG